MRCSHVIDDILDFSKIEAGKLELEREPFDLRECVEGALDIVAPRASEKHVELGCLVGEDVPAGIVGDAARLRQVLLNLLSNAVKFTEEGEVVVPRRRRAGRTRARTASHLAVRDTGIGIPPDRMDRLFESFSQVDASTTRRYGGTGLGLAISRRLVELMGGTMWAESEEGKGSTFHIELPRHGGGGAGADRRGRVALPQLAGKRILVVDDNATNREIVSRQARSWGMERRRGRASLRGARADRPAASTSTWPSSTCVMPEMDGLELAREIRRHRDGARASARPDDLARPACPRRGRPEMFAAQLAKPVKASQLYNALVHACSPRRDATDAAEAAADGRGRRRRRCGSCWPRTTP